MDILNLRNSKLNGREIINHKTFSSQTGLSYQVFKRSQIKCCCLFLSAVLCICSYTPLGCLKNFQHIGLSLIKLLLLLFFIHPRNKWLNSNLVLPSSSRDSTILDDMVSFVCLDNTTWLEQNNFFLNPAYGRHWISPPMRIVAPTP